MTVTLVLDFGCTVRSEASHRARARWIIGGAAGWDETRCLEHEARR